MFSNHFEALGQGRLPGDITQVYDGSAITALVKDFASVGVEVDIDYWFRIGSSAGPRVSRKGQQTDCNVFNVHGMIPPARIG